MLGFVYTFDRTLELKELDQPRLIPNSAVIKVNASSICGTDLRTYRFSSSKIKPPRIIGHELSGIIIELDKDLKEFNRGDRVNLAPAIWLWELSILFNRTPQYV